MQMTRHAERRRAQRGFRSGMVEMIAAYGTAQHAKGAISVTLDSNTIDLIAEDDRRLRHRLERYRGAYLIEGRDGRVVTVARRIRRHRRTN